MNTIRRNGPHRRSSYSHWPEAWTIFEEKFVGKDRSYNSPLFYRRRLDKIYAPESWVWRKRESPRYWLKDEEEGYVVLFTINKHCTYYLERIIYYGYDDEDKLLYSDVTFLALMPAGALTVCKKNFFQLFRGCECCFLPSTKNIKLWTFKWLEPVGRNEILAYESGCIWFFLYVHSLQTILVSYPEIHVNLNYHPT